MRKRIFLGIGSAFLCAAVFSLAWLINYENREQALADQSPSGSHRIAEPTYSRLVIKAWLGNCEAAYKLGRHHVFFSLDANQAIRWYRLAAKCPHAAAKGELLGILMHFQAQDTEVDRLLSEIAELDPKAAEDDRAAVESVRKSRKRPSQ